MLNVLLICNAAMSTSILALRMREAAAKRGIAVRVTAAPLLEVEDYVDDADVVVMGPQVNFALPDVAEMTNVPVTSIDMRTYGTMDGEKVLSDILALL